MSGHYQECINLSWCGIYRRTCAIYVVVMHATLVGRVRLQPFSLGKCFMGGFSISHFENVVTTGNGLKQFKKEACTLVSVEHSVFLAMVSYSLPKHASL